MTTTLKLPSSYEELSQEEMMYLDGGYYIDLPRSGVAWTISVAAALVGIPSIGAAVGKMGKHVFKKTVMDILKGIGILYSKVAPYFNVIFTLATWSVGDGVAYALDRFDRTGLNGRIQW